MKITDVDNDMKVNKVILDEKSKKNVQKERAPNMCGCCTNLEQ